MLTSMTKGMFTDQANGADKVLCKEPVVPGNGMEGRALVRSYADLIILINPAVEGARYEPLHEAISARARKNRDSQHEEERMGAYCPNQKPVLVVLSAENDIPNKLLFQGVRFGSTLFENHSPVNPNYTQAQRQHVAEAEFRSSIKTMGLNPATTRTN